MIRRTGERMPFTDRFGLPFGCAGAAAAAAYVEAIDLLLAAWPGAEAALDRALAADPEFALAQIARARLLQQQARIPEAKAAAARAQALSQTLSRRERSHIAIIVRAIDGEAAGAMAALREHLADWPRDALPLSLALGVFGLFGFSGRRDHHDAQLALLEELAPRWDEDWWFLGYLGWAYIETGAVARGTALVERSLALRPQNAHGAHQRAHGYFEAGDAAGGARFLAEWLSGYDRSGYLHCHLSWHLALCALAEGDTARAHALYRDAIRPSVAQTAPMLSLADAASLLWRWRLYGAAPALDREWAEVAAHAHRHFPRAGIGFADLHAALADAASADPAAVEARIAQLREMAAAGRLPAGEVTPALCAGVAAFAEGRYADAARLLAAALPELDRVGGSHAQRELFADTLIAARLRAGEPERAAELLRARLDRRPSSRDAAWLAACAG
jgi:hypothetical protein